MIWIFKLGGEKKFHSLIPFIHIQGLNVLISCLIWAQNIENSIQISIGYAINQWKLIKSKQNQELTNEIMNRNYDNCIVAKKSNIFLSIKMNLQKKKIEMNFPLVNHFHVVKIESHIEKWQTGWLDFV